MKFSLTGQPLYQATLQTPLGLMIAIADEHHLYGLDFADKPHDINNITEKHVTPLASIERELTLYFSGSLKTFTTPIKMVGTDFQKEAWQALQNIPFGETRSYLQQAETIHKPKAFRAVANANGANRLSIIIPCHRIINHNGQLGGYAGGLDRKSWLLQHESHILLHP